LSFRGAPDEHLNTRHGITFSMMQLPLQALRLFYQQAPPMRIEKKFATQQLFPPVCVLARGL
jgi:hypothetical protein